MNKLEITLSSISAICLVLMAIGVPLAHTVLWASLGSLALLYFLASYPILHGKAITFQYLKESASTPSKKWNIENIFGVTSAINLIGILFKLAYLPGSLVMLKVGFYAQVIVVIWSFLKVKKNDPLVAKNILIRSVIFLTANELVKWVM